jgi:hypothetical protein
MWLAGIERDGQPDHDKRTFHCSECDHYEALVVPRHYCVRRFQHPDPSRRDRAEEMRSLADVTACK